MPSVSPTAVLSASSRPKRSVNTLSLRNVTCATIRAISSPSVGSVTRVGVVVVAATPLRVEPDRPAADRTPRDLLGRGLHARGDRNEGPHPAGIHDRPLQGLHAAHRAADHRHPRRHPEVLHQPGLRSDHVADGDDREPRSVRQAVDRVWRGRPGGALTAAEHVGAHDEVPVGVDRLAGPDRLVPPARGRMTSAGRTRGVAVTGPRVTQQHGVGGVGVESPPGLVRHHHVGQRHTAIEREPAIGGEGEEPAMAGLVTRTPGARHGEGVVRAHPVTTRYRSPAGRTPYVVRTPTSYGMKPLRSGYSIWTISNGAPRYQDVAVEKYGPHRARSIGANRQRSSLSSEPDQFDPQRDLRAAPARVGHQGHQSVGGHRRQPEHRDIGEPDGRRQADRVRVARASAVRARRRRAPVRAPTRSSRSSTRSCRRAGCGNPAVPSRQCDICGPTPDAMTRVTRQDSSSRMRCDIDRITSSANVGVSWTR